MMGGRIAEEMFLNQMTTGAGNDIERATELARKMVCEFGMSDLGPLTFGKKEEQIFLGREIAQHRDYSEATAIKIDDEVRRIVAEGIRQRQGHSGGEPRRSGPDCAGAAGTRSARCQRDPDDHRRQGAADDHSSVEGGRWRAAGAEAGAGTSRTGEGRRASSASVETADRFTSGGLRAAFIFHL